jgi:hypothetical protein
MLFIFFFLTYQSISEGKSSGGAGTPCAAFDTSADAPTTAIVLVWA